MSSINSLTSKMQQLGTKCQHSLWTLPLECLPCKQFSNPNWVRETLFFFFLLNHPPAYFVIRALSTFSTLKMLITINMQTLNMAQASRKKSVKDHCLPSVYVVVIVYHDFLCRKSVISLWNPFCRHARGIWKACN